MLFAFFIIDMPNNIRIDRGTETDDLGISEKIFCKLYCPIIYHSVFPRKEIMDIVFTSKKLAEKRARLDD